MSFTAFRTFGRSGLIVSPLALETMTFGTPRWGASDEISESVFHTYVDAGGNFIDTADVYAKGRSEELVGCYIHDRNWRVLDALRTVAAQVDRWRRSHLPGFSTVGYHTNSRMIAHDRNSHALELLDSFGF